MENVLHCLQVERRGSLFMFRGGEGQGRSSSRGQNWGTLALRVEARPKPMAQGPKASLVSQLPVLSICLPFALPFVGFLPPQCRSPPGPRSLPVPSWKGNGMRQLAGNLGLGVSLSGFKSNLCAHCVTRDKCSCLSFPICKAAIRIALTSVALLRLK